MLGVDCSKLTVYCDRVVSDGNFRNREKTDETKEEMKNEEDNKLDHCCYGNRSGIWSIQRCCSAKIRSKDG
jgi:hypothetical protein